MQRSAVPAMIDQRLAGGDPALNSDSSLDLARRLLAKYHAGDDQQLSLRDEMLAFIDRFPETAHLRSCLTGHLTGSALVVDHRLERALLLHHRKLGKWLQPGGHCDGDANLLGVAWREASEETGIEGLEIVPAVIDVDIHDIPARLHEPAHRHLDTRFLVIAPEGAEPKGNEESNELRWFTPEAGLRVADRSLARMLRWLKKRSMANIDPLKNVSC